MKSTNLHAFVVVEDIVAVVAAHLGSSPDSDCGTTWLVASHGILSITPRKIQHGERRYTLFKPVCSADWD